MAKAILQISYDVRPDQLKEYIELAKKMRDHFTTVRKKNYEVFEAKGKGTTFVEQFTCATWEEYEALEDDLDETSEALVQKLEDYVVQGTTRYVTLKEME